LKEKKFYIDVAFGPIGRKAPRYYSYQSINTLQMLPGASLNTKILCRSQGQIFTEANILITSLVRYIFNVVYGDLTSCPYLI